MENNCIKIILNKEIMTEKNRKNEVVKPITLEELNTKLDIILELVSN